MTNRPAKTHATPAADAAAFRARRRVAGSATRSPIGRRAPAFTLLELLIAVAMVAVLTGLVVVAGKSVHNSMRKSRAENQLAVLAEAIERYSQSWAPWRIKPVSSRGIVALSDRGLPDWSGRRLFQVSGDPLYDENASKPDYNMLSGEINDPNVTTRLDFSDDDNFTIPDNRRDVEFAGECLAYCLTERSGGGPFLANPPQGLVNEHDDEFYPTIGNTTDLRRRFELLDPWGNSFRFFWVVRDAETSSGWRPIPSVDYTDQSTDPFLGGPRGSVVFGGSPRSLKAEGYVLESAGPDGRFGNIWRRNFTATNLAWAEDNMTIKP